ncbi:MAG: integrase arm-type DNA-binding domain-containing protein [Pseudomonadales bacterium]|jgi:integrase|nr:integrase arm-type DNA-binding domain-containing protein [Pseudomonadales bacterium]
MPKRAKELSAVEVRRLAARKGCHAVGGVAGLYLNVKPTLAASWLLRTMVGARRREMGLGPYPAVTLARAREKARHARELIEAGRDPAEERKAARAALVAAQRRMTFADATDAYLALREAEFRNPKHAAQWRTTLETYAHPVFGTVPVADVELAHVVAALEPIWTTKTETASRVRGRIEAVLSWATVAGHREGDNPARWKGHLDQVFPAPSKVARVSHFAALPFDDLPGFVTALRGRDGMAARAVEFAILTAARSGEVRGATWAEIDREGAVWTVPRDRMKAGKEHRVPLSEPALALLEALPRFAGSDLVFPGARGGQLSDASLGAVLKRMGVPVTVHGFRSTFRDWTAERTAYARDVCEMALAHVIESGTERAYRRGDLLEKRRRLMAEWARFAEGAGAGGAVVAVRA